MKLIRMKKIKKINKKKPPKKKKKKSLWKIKILKKIKSKIKMNL